MQRSAPGQLVLMNGKECGRKRSWLNLKSYRKICVKASVNLNEFKRSPGKDLNPRPTKYKSGVLNRWVEPFRLPNTGFTLTEKEYGA
jgi:hypothetical protein